MGFFDAILKALFGRGNPKPAPPPHRGETLPPKPMAPPAPLPTQISTPERTSAPGMETPESLPPSPQLAPPAPPVPSATGFISLLVAADKTPLSQADFDAAAKRLGCESAALRAVVDVECGPNGTGFDKKGRPTILFEPHWFSQLTTPKRKYDQTHPDISYVSWGAKPYPKTADGNWARLEEAFPLDPDAALQSVSWGRFQIMGFNHKLCGYANVRDFVLAMVKSEKAQLEAFEKFVRAKQIDDDLQRQDWAGFAHTYNGPQYAKNKYDTKLATAYAAWKAKGVGV
jgi:hypothetical protein